MKGASYSGFSGSLVLNHLLKAIMRHVHLIKPSDRPEDPTHGEFWKRHRRLDNQLSTLFMFMPDKFHLPENLQNPLATYINLNFHACVICLHHVALDVIEKHGLGAALRKDSRYLLKNAADEIANIVKMTSHRSSLFVRPFLATLKTRKTNRANRAILCVPSRYIVQQRCTFTWPKKIQPRE